MPEPFGKGSNLAYTLMTEPIQEADSLGQKDELPEDYEQRVAFLQEILRRANARANKEMIGIVTPAQRMWRTVTAICVLIVIAITFVLVFRKIIRAFTPPKIEGVEKHVKWGFRRYKWAYLIMLPAVLTILIWRYIPLARGSIMAFQDYRLLGNSTFVWLNNFGDILYDNAWWISIWHALRYSFLIMSLTFLPPIILAILLQEVPRGKILFRTLYYLPAVITGLVTILLWRQFYEPSEKGALNAVVMQIPALGFIVAGVLLLMLAIVFSQRMWYHGMHLPAWLFTLAGLILLGTFLTLAKPILIGPKESFWQAIPHIFGRLLHKTPEPYRWMLDPSTAMLSCVIPMVWAGIGPGCLIYLAALKGVPDDLYEAADIDGSTFVDKILFVVFPILKPLIIINFIGVFIGSWYGAAGRILAMTGGVAGTEVAGLHIFYKAFVFLKFGPATAMAWMLATMLIGFTVHQLQILSRLEFRTTGKKE